MSEFLGSITFLIIAWYGGKQIIEYQNIAPEELRFLSMFSSPNSSSCKEFIQLYSPFKKESQLLKRVMEILEADIKIEEISEPIRIHQLEKGIEFKNVCFAYNENKQILNNFSLNIPKGKTVALVGQSEAVKPLLPLY